MIVIYQYAKLNMLNSNDSLTPTKLGTTRNIHVTVMSVKV